MIGLIEFRQGVSLGVSLNKFDRDREMNRLRIRELNIIIYGYHKVICFCYTK